MIEAGEGKEARVEWVHDCTVLRSTPVSDPILGFRTGTFDTIVWKLIRATERGDPKDYYDLIVLSRLGEDMVAAARCAASLMPGGRPAGDVVARIRRGAMKRITSVSVIPTTERISLAGLRHDVVLFLDSLLDGLDA